MTGPDAVAWKRLRALWDKKRRDLDLTQEKAAAEFGKSQGLIAQYLNGHTALGPVATLRWARLLQCSPTEIRPDFDLGTIVPAELPPDVVEIAILLASLPPETRRDSIGYLRMTLAGHRFAA